MHFYTPLPLACAVLAIASAWQPVNAAMCEAGPEGGPMQITADCTDPQFNRPVIDRRIEVALPYPHYRVSGHFAGTAATFNFYFPSKAQWKGRFFQKVYPMTGGEASDDTLRFGLDSGGYTVETASQGGYRSDAAAAVFAKTIARQYYGMPTGPIFGYVYGGSGGSYQTIGAIENTAGIWDGAVPFVVGGPTSIPNNFFVRAFARLVLKDKAERIADAVRPGGNGNPYAGLDDTERAVLAEVSAMGVPIRGWSDDAYLLGLKDPQSLLGFASAIRGMDPTYVDDFWRKPGYLGTAQSALGNLVRARRITRTATVGPIASDSHGKPTGFILGGPRVPADAFGLDYTICDAAGNTVGQIAGSFDAATQALTLAEGNTAPVLAAINSGATLQLDNSWAIALASYHRHQVPTESGFAAWDQFRGPDGAPLYPQRAVLAGAQIGRNVSGGGTHSGKIHGKVIVVANTLDVDAFPWHAHWYAQRVEAALGKRYDDNFRVWLNDNADHLDGSVIASGTHDTRWVRLVNYDGIVNQALRDMSAWVENGIAPLSSTSYRVDNGQVTLAAAASDRHGVQPTVELLASSGESVEVAAGEPVTLRGRIRMPPGAGQIVATEWSQTGADNFVAAPLAGPPAAQLDIERTFTYATPGTYYAVLRVTANREGDVSASVRHIRNLARVRVVVR